MSRSEKGTNAVTAVVVIAILAYFGSYSLFRYVYGNSVTSVFPQRLTLRGTFEGDMVKRLERVFVPAKKLEARITGDEPVFFVLEW